ncbi:MAG: arylsulfotransferase family protein [Rhizobiaceae bacterium]
MQKLISIVSALFLLALTAHFFGLLSAHKNWKSYEFFKEGVLALEARKKLERSTNPPDLIRAGRRQLPPNSKLFPKLASEGPPILVAGGIGTFKDLCGEPGCLAVLFNRHGVPIRKWPLKLKEYAEANALSEGQYAYAGSNILNDITIGGIDRLPGDELLVTFVLRNSFPYSWGIARIAADGSVVWRHRDHYHHWARTANNGNIYSPLHEIRVGEKYAEGLIDTRNYVVCRAPGKQYADLIHVISPQGEIKKKIDLVKLFVQDPRFSTILSKTINKCDPLHLNYIDVAVSSDIGDATWLEEGDIMVSLRGLSTVAIISADGTKIKRVISGSFVVQHSAHFSGNGKMTLFDNMGSSADSLASRVLEIDLNSSVERVLFSRSSNDVDKAEYTAAAGSLALSRDGKRILAVYTQSGRVVEIDVATGERLSVFDHYHKWSTNKAPGLFKIYSALYWE